MRYPGSTSKLERHSEFPAHVRPGSIQLRVDPAVPLAGGGTGCGWVSEQPIPSEALQADALESEPAPFIVRRPGVQTAPVVFASAHSGRYYPASFLAESRLSPLELRRSEDGFVDELFAAAPAAGAPLLAAVFPRAFCDLNREKWELDPAMFDDALPPWVNTGSARVMAGLGTIARVVGSGEAIYRGRLSFAEAERRVRAYWEPWHAALAGLLAETRARFECCLLIDCHSMPTQRCAAPLGRGRGQPDVVLGDAHGTSCSPAALQLVETVLRDRGYRVARNDPYAGGYITRHYGRPKSRVHALQIEIARELYMDEARLEKQPGFGALETDLAILIGSVTDQAATLMAR